MFSLLTLSELWPCAMTLLQGHSPQPAWAWLPLMGHSPHQPHHRCLLHLTQPLIRHARSLLQGYSPHPAWALMPLVWLPSPPVWMPSSPRLSLTPHTRQPCLMDALLTPLGIRHIALNNFPPDTLFHPAQGHCGAIPRTNCSLAPTENVDILFLNFFHIWECLPIVFMYETW